MMIQRSFPIIVAGWLLGCTALAAPASIVATFSSEKDLFNAEHVPNAGNTPVAIYGAPGANFLDLAAENETFTERIFIRFNLSSIAGNGIASATLRLHSRNTISPTDDIDVYRVTAAWADDDSSWNNRIQSTTTPWATPGGDFANSLGVQALSSPYASNKWQTGANDWNVTNLVQQWVNGTFANEGFMIVKRVTQSHQQAFYYSSNHTNAAEHPSLTVIYPEPVAMAPLALGVWLVARRKR